MVLEGKKLFRTAVDDRQTLLLLVQKIHFQHESGYGLQILIEDIRTNLIRSIEFNPGPASLARKRLIRTSEIEAAMLTCKVLKPILPDEIEAYLTVVKTYFV